MRRRRAGGDHAGEKAASDQIAAGRQDGTRSRSLGLLRPVEVRSAADIVYERLQTLILDGTLGPGERLPTEPSLSEALGVGRSTVREAKKALTAQGLIETRGKLGTFVVGPPARPEQLPALRELLSDPTLPDLHEARQIIEVGAIRLATQRASNAELTGLYEALDRISVEMGDNEPGAWVRLIGFHRQIVRLSGNRVLLSVYDLIAHLLRQHHVVFYPSVTQLESEVRSHRELVDLIGNREADPAADAMAEHLRASEKLRRDALGEDTPREAR